MYLMSINPVAQINQLLSEGKYQQALQLAQQYGLTQTAQQIQAYINITQLLRSAKEALKNYDYNTALNDLQQALQIAQQYPNLVDVTDIQQQIQVVQALQQIQQYINNANSELEKANFAGAYQYLQQALQLAQQYNLSDKELEDVTTAVSYLAKIPPFPQPPKGEMTLQELQQYLQTLNSYFATASQYATEASRYYSGFSSLANRYRQSQQVSSQLLSVVNLLINAQNIAQQNSDSVPAIQNAINLIQQAQKQSQTINANNTPLAGLANTIFKTVQEMYIEYTAYLQVLEDLKKSQQEAENGNYSEAVQYLQQAQQIAQQNGFNINLSNYIQGFTILEGLQPLPKPPSTQTFLSLSQYFASVYQILQENYQVLEKASKYLQINLQAVQGDIQDAKYISQALQLLAEAQQLLTPSQNNKSPSSIIEAILANKDMILSDISQALQLLSSSQSYDMQSTAKQLFEIAQNYQTQVQTYLAGLEKTQQALDYLNTVNVLLTQKQNPNSQSEYITALQNNFTETFRVLKASVTQKVNASSPSAYFLALQNKYNQALGVLKKAMSSAMQANSLFEQIKATPPFDMDQLEKEYTALEQFSQLFGTTAIAYSSVEKVLNSQNNLNTPSDYAKYYQNVASTIRKAIQQINSLQITDDDVNQVRQQIVQSLQESETDYLALSHAFNIIASAKVTIQTKKFVRIANRLRVVNVPQSEYTPQALARAYNEASQYLSQYPDLQKVARLFANLSQFYTLIGQANDLLQQAQASSSISTEISLMEQAKGYLQQALQYIPSNSQVYQEIQNEISNINNAVIALQNAQSLEQQLKNALNNGDWASALYYYKELLRTTQGIDISNVFNDVVSNNYFKAIQDVNNNPSLQPQQKQFLNSLIATIGINTYYLPLMQSSLQQAHLQASSWGQALSETFNFTEQMQPVVTNLQNALQYAQDAEYLAQYVSPQVQQSLSQVVSRIQGQYNAIEEQIQKAQSNGFLNAFEGFANVFNTGLNNMMNDINNFIYSHLGQNTFTEILAGLADAGVFMVISAIPIVGQAFDFMATISFVGETVFDLLAGSASFNETVNSFKQMFTNPTSISMIATLIASVLARRLIEPDNVGSIDLAKTTDSVKSVLTKLEDSIKDRVDISTISDKVTNTVKSDVTESPDFSKINDIVKEVNLDKLDIKALKKGLGNKIVKIEGTATKLVDIDVSDSKITTTTYYIFNKVNLKAFDGIDRIEVKLSKDFTKGIEVNVKPEPINEAIATFENGKVKLTTVSEETIKNLLASNKLAEALDTIKLNLSTIVAKQLFDKLQTADGNIVKISPDEGVAYIGGKFYDVLYKDGNIVKMEAIGDLEAMAKLEKFAEDTVGNFVTLNKDLIEQLLKNNENLQSIEYQLSNKVAGNVVRNEYFKLKDALGRETTFRSKTEINPGEIKVTNEIQGTNLPEISQNISYLTPQDVAKLLSNDNRVSRIFKPLIDEHPEVKDLLEKLASQGKLPASLRSLQEIAGKIEKFYEALDSEVEEIESELNDNPLFEGVNVKSVVSKIAEKQILNNPDAVLNGEVPSISLSDVLDHLNMTNKAKVVLNYLRADPKVYDEVMKKLENFSPETRDYILGKAYNLIANALKGALENGNNISITPEGLSDLVDYIDNVINEIENGGSTESQTPGLTTASSNGTASPTTSETAEGTASNASSNGTVTVQQSQVQQQGVQTNVSITTTLENALSKLFPDFNNLSSAEKALFMKIVNAKLEEEGGLALTNENLMKMLEDAKAQYQSILDSVKKLYDDVKAETTSAKEEKSVTNNLSTSIVELEKKVGFDLRRLSYLLSVASFVADKFNVATALELMNQLNSLTPQQLHRTFILTQPQLETITNITPLLKEIIVKLNNGVKPKDLLDLATQIRVALEKMGINLDVEQLIRVINALQTITKEFNVKISDLASLIAVNDVNGLTVIPVPIISNIKSLITFTQAGINNEITGNTTSVGTEEIPETTLAVGTIPLQGTMLQQLQQLLTPPPAVPPNANATESGTQGGGLTIPPSYSTPQFASYQSKQQYLII